MTLRNILAWVVLMAGALVITYTFAPSRGSRELIPVEKRAHATEFVLKDSTGQTVNLSDYKDKVVLLNFWATWCGPCKIEIPWFVEFEKAYKTQGFAVLGVSSDEDGWKVVKPFMESHNMNYRVVLDDQKMPAPYKDIQSIPTTYLLDRQGRVAVIHNGLVSKDTYESGIQQLLAR